MGKKRPLNTRKLKFVVISYMESLLNNSKYIGEQMLEIQIETII